MTRHLFITPDGIAEPRWRAAFPELACVKAAAPDGVAAGREAVVWVTGTGLAEWIGRFHRLHPGVPLVALSLQPCQEEALATLGAGARGYCHALATPEMLRQVALVVAAGGLWIGAELMGRILGATAAALPAAEAGGALLAELTEREREVAREVARGATNKEAARRLGITERTVKAHLGSVFEKLGVRDRLQLVLRLKEAEAVPVPTA